MFIYKNKPNIGKICQIRRTVIFFVKLDKNADLRASTWGDGWKFGAPHAKILSNPALFIAGFGCGERQRLEVLLEYIHTKVVLKGSTDPCAQRRI
jgi:hypothetical protein